jgi:hypothetical protein
MSWIRGVEAVSAEGVGTVAAGILGWGIGDGRGDWGYIGGLDGYSRYLAGVTLLLEEERGVDSIAHRCCTSCPYNWEIYSYTNLLLPPSRLCAARPISIPSASVQRTTSFHRPCIEAGRERFSGSRGRGCGMGTNTARCWGRD